MKHGVVRLVILVAVLVAIMNLAATCLPDCNGPDCALNPSGCVLCSGTPAPSGD